MASARAPGTYAVYIESPSGQRKLVKSAPANWWNCSGLGSADGTMSTTATPEKLNFLPPSADVGGPGYKIVIAYKASAAKTLDASDCTVMLPVIVNGQLRILGNDDNGGIGLDEFTVVRSPADDAYVADNEAPFQVVRANEGVFFRVGGDKTFISLEDNTA